MLTTVELYSQSIIFYSRFKNHVFHENEVGHGKLKNIKALTVSIPLSKQYNSLL